MQRREFLRILRWLPVSGGAAAAAATTAYGYEDGTPEPDRPYSVTTQISGRVELADGQGHFLRIQPGRDGHLWLKIANKWRRIVTE